MNFEQFIRPELLVLIPVLYLAGVGIKKGKLKDELIPILLGILGVVLALIYLIATQPIENAQDFASCMFLGITQGILCAGASVYVNQIIKQAGKLVDEKETEEDGEQ